MSNPKWNETLSEEELAKVKVLSPEEIREALERAQETFDKCRRRHAIYPRYR